MGELVATVQGFAALGLEHGDACLGFGVFHCQHFAQAAELGLVLGQRFLHLLDGGRELVSLGLAVFERPAHGLELSLDCLGFACVLCLRALALGARNAVVGFADQRLLLIAQRLGGF